MGTDKAWKVYEEPVGDKKVIESQSNPSRNSDQQRQAIETFVEAAVWQGLASVIIPGFAINRICFFVGRVLSRGAGVSNPTIRNSLTAGAGIASIPFIIKPIDRLVDTLLLNVKLLL